MEKLEKHLRNRVGLKDGKLVAGVYTNGFVSFTIQYIREGDVLLYANTDIPYLGLSEDESLHISVKELGEMFLDVLDDFSLTHGL